MVAEEPSPVQTLEQQRPTEDAAVVVTIHLADGDEGKTSVLPDAGTGELEHHQEGEGEAALQDLPNLHRYPDFCIKKGHYFVPSYLSHLF